MKAANRLVAAVIIFASIPVMVAQQGNTQAVASASGVAAGAQVSDSTNAGGGASAGPGHENASQSGGTSQTAEGRSNTADNGSGNISALRLVKGALEGKLDSKTAGPGDLVVLKTSQKMTMADGTVIPKGSRLVGQVTEVQAHEQGHAKSYVLLNFDHVELKGGQSLKVYATILSVLPSASAMAFQSAANDDYRNGAVAADKTGMGSGERPNVTGDQEGWTASGGGSAPGRGGSSPGSTADGAARGVGGMASGARGSGIPGVQLLSGAPGSTSGLLWAANQNVHLDSGTQMGLGIEMAQ